MSLDPVLSILRRQVRKKHEKEAAPKPPTENAHKGNVAAKVDQTYENTTICPAKTTPNASKVAPEPHRSQPFQRQSPTVPTREPRSADVWSAEEISLLSCFESIEPSSISGYFSPCIQVLEPQKFYDALRHDIEAGPGGPRAKTGALREDLRRLRKLSGREG